MSAAPTTVSTLPAISAKNQRRGSRLLPSVQPSTIWKRANSSFGMSRPGLTPVQVALVVGIAGDGGEDGRVVHSILCTVEWQVSVARVKQIGGFVDSAVRGQISERSPIVSGERFGSAPFPATVWST